jgi:hypothetical protein
MSGRPRLVSWVIDITECGQAEDVPFQPVGCQHITAAL